MKSFAIINPVELSELAKLHASGCAVLTYTTLAGFSRNKASCFPSIRTISEALGNAYTTRAIQKALKWLEDNQLIKRNEKRSKQRFILLKRLKMIGTNVRKALQRTDVPHKRSSEKNSLLKRGKQRFKRFSRKKNEMGYGRFGSAENEADNKPKCRAERIFEAWMIKNPSLDVKTINKTDLSVIVECLNSPAPEDVEWREAMSWSESNKFIFDKLLAL